MFIDLQGRGFNIKIQENTLIDSKLKDKLTETIAQKFFFLPKFFLKREGALFFFQVIIFSISKFIPNLYTLKKILFVGWYTKVIISKNYKETVVLMLCVIVKLLQTSQSNVLCWGNCSCEV